MVLMGHTGHRAKSALWTLIDRYYGRTTMELTMSTRTADAEPLLTPAEVATMFRVDPKTVTRWAKAGKLTSIRTLGGHRRYREAEVRSLLAGVPQQRTT
jgi:excisionase family DNA binding protein